LSRDALEARLNLQQNLCCKSSATSIRKIRSAKIKLHEHKKTLDKINENYNMILKTFLKGNKMPIRVAGLKLYTLDELSKILEVNKVTLRGYIQQGCLKAVKMGRSYRVTEEHLREFLLRRGRALSKEEGIELKEIPTGHLGKIKEKALTRQSTYEDYLDPKIEND
jgi:excisionase family DNA binding protein